MRRKILVSVALTVVLAAGFLSLSSCSSKKKVISDDYAVEAADAGFTSSDLETPDTQADKSVASGKDEFSEFDDKSTTSPEQASSGDTAGSEASLEAELNKVAPETVEPSPPLKNEKTENLEQAKSAPIEEKPTETIAASPVPSSNQVPPPVIESSITPSQDGAAPAENGTGSLTKTGRLAKIQSLQFKGNDSGGALVISSNQPLVYKTRTNPGGQVVIEIENATIPTSLKRPLYTKDMSSSIGAVDVYQKNKSSVVRFVVQLRPNSPEPLVQPEGNSLLVIGSPLGSVATHHSDESVPSDTAKDGADNSEVNVDLTSQGIMSTSDLEEFLANNNKFYGKKISIETTDMDVREILKFISEESGINMIFDDDVSGKATLKLRKVPWDQALVILLKSKKLGYRRQGSILRVAKIDTLFKEDEDSIKLKQAKASVEPLVVKNFAINYAEVDKLETKIKDFITETSKDAVTRGRVTSDSRTGMLIVTETPTKLAQVEALIRALDTQPQQVMIEGRIIEASDQFSRTISVNLGLNKDASVSSPMGKWVVNGQPVNITTSTSSTTDSASSIFSSALKIGALGGYGDLDATLKLNETQKKLKILSSPRVSVVTNSSATINQGATVLVPDTSSTTSSSSTTTQTFKSVQVGVTLKVKPQISNQGTVRLALNVTRSAAVPNSTDITNRSVDTEVIVKSGQTAVIGGVFQADTGVSVSGVPGLKDLPVLGTLFRSNVKTNQKSELMIFITPKILAPLVPVAGAEPDSTGQVQ